MASDTGGGGLEDCQERVGGGEAAGDSEGFTCERGGAGHQGLLRMMNGESIDLDRVPGCLMRREKCKIQNLPMQVTVLPGQRAIQRRDTNEQICIRHNHRGRPRSF